MSNIRYLRKKRSSKKGIALSKNGLLYLLLLLVAFLRQSGLIPMYYMTSVLIAALMFALGWIRNPGLKTNSSKGYILITGKMFLMQWIVFVLNNILIYITGNGNISFMKSSFIQIMFPPIILLGAFGFFYVFKEHALKYFVYAIVVHYFFLLIFQFIAMGPNAFFEGVLSVFSGNSVHNPFETNSDLVLALGLLVIFYSDKFVKIKDRSNNHLILMALLVFLGGKKISFVALILIAAFFVLSKKIPIKKRTKIETAISWFVVIASYAYIYLIKNGYLSIFVYGRGINTMGRIKMYDYIAQYMDFKLSFLGKGYSFANLLLEQDEVLTYNGVVYGLHSDVLKMFVEMGTIVFGFWLVYNLLYLPKKLMLKYGPEVGNLFWFMTMYLFSTYLTDNTINYYITQTLFVVLTLHTINMKKYDIGILTGNM